MFFHDAAAVSEELCEEALRCQSPSISSIRHKTIHQYPHRSASVACRSIGSIAEVMGGVKRTVAVLVAPLFTAPRARALRCRVERASMVGDEQSK